MILEVMGVLNWVLYLNFYSFFLYSILRYVLEILKKWIAALQETPNFSFEKIENPAGISGVFFELYELIIST